MRNIALSKYSQNKSLWIFMLVIALCIFPSKAYSQSYEFENTPSEQPPTIVFLIDASSTMKDTFGKDTQKMDVAKQLLQKALSRIKGDVNLGVRVFGRSTEPGVEPCNATELLVPAGTRNRAAIITKMRDVRPTGMKPLTSAIAQSVEGDFVRATGTKTILLITDGGDSCGFDPCAYVETLPSKGISLKIDVFCLGLKNAQSRKQLDRIAKSSGGEFYDVQSPDEFSDNVSKILQSTTLRQGAP